MSKICKVDGCEKSVFGLGLCSMHYSRNRRYGTTDAPQTKRERLLGEGMSHCPKCGETKPRDQFNKDMNTAFGVSIYCKSCISQKGRDRYTAHPDKYKNYSLLRDFGITLDEYKRIETAQGGVCAICQKKSPGRALAVDHCHTTGNVRGLLCSDCNLALGKFCDDTIIMRRAIAYLENRENSGTVPMPSKA